MRFRRKYNDTTAEIYLGHRSLQNIEGELDALRCASGQIADVLTSVKVFLADTSRWNTLPIAVLMRKGKTVYGTVLLHAHMKYGMPTGMVKAGHACGRGAVIAVTQDRSAVAEIAAQILLRSRLVHTVAVRLMRCDVDSGTLNAIPAREVDGFWLLRDKPSSISLEGGMEAVMARLSSKMRRNLRYYRKQAEGELACVFIPQLSPAQSRQAVQVLNNSSIYPIPAALALRYEAALRDTSDSFAMGVQDGAGNWLSFLAGWRYAQIVYVEWQLNSMDHSDASLSTVMRAYFLEHEINQGTLKIIFVGGTTPTWSRACEPQICGDLVIVRKGFVGFMARKLSQFLRPRGQIAELHRVLSDDVSFEGVESVLAGPNSPTH